MDGTDAAPRRGADWRWGVAGLAALGLPALLIVFLQSRFEGLRVPVVGAGAIAVLAETDAPEGARFELDVREREPASETHARATDAIGAWPDVIVLAVDARELADGDGSEARGALLRMTTQAENATAVPVVLGFVAPRDASPDLAAAVERANVWWREDLCRAPGALRVCVEVASEQEVPAAIAAAVADAMYRHDELEASTQVGR